MKGRALAIGRNAEIATLVDQQLAIDAEQALGCSSLNLIIRWDGAISAIALTPVAAYSAPIRVGRSHLTVAT
jgi:hypothetical protein